MNILVVSAHPLKNSLCNTFTEQIRSILIARDHEVVITNLYEENFNPVLFADERKSYYEEKYNSAGVDPEIQRLLSSDALVLVFPTWWFGFPAIMKGWFDRVWAPTVAYDHADDYGPIRPRLERLKKALVVTTLGAPWWVDLFVMRKPLKRIVKTALLGACARRCQLTYLSFYKCETVDENRIKTFSRKIDAVLNRWLA